MFRIFLHHQRCKRQETKNFFKSQFLGLNYSIQIISSSKETQVFSNSSSKETQVYSNPNELNSTENSLNSLDHLNKLDNSFSAKENYCNMSADKLEKEEKKKLIQFTKLIQEKAKGKNSDQLKFVVDFGTKKVAVDAFKGAAQTRITSTISDSVHGLEKLIPQIIPQIPQIQAQSNEYQETKEMEQNNHLKDTKTLINGDLIFYNNLLNYYTQNQDYEAAFKLFDQIKQVFKPDLVTYACLINAAVKSNDADTAFKLYEEMKIVGLHPNGIIFTNLIQVCSKTNQLDRAWKIFTHLKREIEKPDSIAYTLMISLCARTQAAEKALDLYHEMQEYGVGVQVATWNNLVRACGLRSDYYSEAWVVLRRMVEQGVDPNIYTYRTLMEIAAFNNDLKRARIVWNDYVARINPLVFEVEAGKGNPHETILRPDVYVISQFMRNFYEVLGRGTVFEENVAEGARQIRLPSELEVTAGSGSVSGDLDAGSEVVELNGKEAEPEPETFIAKATLDRMPIFDTKLKTIDQVLEESKLVWQSAVGLAASGHIDMIGELYTRQLDLLCTDTTLAGMERALAFFDSVPPEQGRFTLRAYKNLLKQACMTGEVSKRFGELVWRKFLDWDAHLEEEINMKRESAHPLSLQEREDTRAKTKRTRRNMQVCFFIRASGKLKEGDLEGAIQILKDSACFRSPYYLPTIQLKNVLPILCEAQRQAEMGHLEHLKALRDLCHSEKDQGLESVRKLLAQKTVPLKWWGWKAAGISDDDKKRILKVNHQRTRKLDQKATEAAKRGQRHNINANAGKKSVVFKGYLK